MDEAYTGEIRMFAGTYAPMNWEFCRGQELSIYQYQALFELIGTRYGGDGKTRFRLPDMRMRIPVGAGAGPGLTPIGEAEKGGVEKVTLTVENLPAHTHTATMQASMADAGTAAPTINTSMLALAQAVNTGSGDHLPVTFYSSTATSPVTMDPSSVVLSNSDTGSASPRAHYNMQPYIVINFIICLIGYWPGKDNSTKGKH